MKSPDNVLLGIAFLLLAGVILYNVFTADEIPAESTITTSAATGVSTTQAAPLTTDTTTTVLSSAKININTASAEELMSLSGIGPTKAQAIVDYRDANGPFLSIDDLVKVSGIGEKTLAKIRQEITV